MRKFLLPWLAVGGVALAQPASTPTVPAKHIPPTVMLELRLLENQFDQALGRDCAPEKCVSKGCSYRDHVVVDLPRNTSLPGLPQTEGLGAVPAQEYLTQAVCAFAHEKSVQPRDSLALVKRLEQRLSKGWLKVTLAHELLEPISPMLAESPPPRPEVVPPEPIKPEAKALPEQPVEWDAKRAARELWVTLLPHFFWMIALLLGTVAALTLIWGSRRVGRETLEEKALAASLTAGPPKPDEPVKEPAPELAAPPAPSVDEPDEAFVAAQRELWRARIDQAELGKDGGGLMQLLRDWLRAREFGLLAKAIFVFGDRLSAALPADGELAARKVEFADYLRDLDEESLPKDGAFYRTLHHHTVSSALLSQSDAETYRSLSAEFGAAGVASLMATLGGRPGALLFALVPDELQREVARALVHDAQLEVAGHLLDSNRMSADERTYLFSAIDSARAGATLPTAPRGHAQDIPDRGHPFDAAGALSVLLPHLTPAERKVLLAQRANDGAVPQWYENVLFAQMFSKLPSAELKSDLLLEVDVKPLAGWLSVQPVAMRDAFVSGLSDTFQGALRASASFSSRAEQLRAARAGQEALVSSFKRLYARGQASFIELAG